MRQIMSGEVTPAQIAGILIGLRVKKETIGEISAAAQVMREFATKVPVADRDHLVDTCGTGGDAAHTFNISTASALRRRSGRRAGGQARRALGVLHLRLGGRAGSAGRQPQPDPGTGRPVHRRNRHRLHVRAQLSRRDEIRRAGAARTGRAHHVQRAGAADQSGRRRATR